MWNGDQSFVVSVVLTSSCLQVFELICEKYTGRRIVRQGSIFSSGRFSGDHGNNHARRVSSQSNSSSSGAETQRRMPQTSANTYSSSLGGSGSKMTPQPPIPLQEVVAEGRPGESAEKRTCSVTCASPDCDEVFVPLHHPSEIRRPSILKLIPSTRLPENKRGLHHVQFTESKPPT